MSLDDLWLLAEARGNMVLQDRGVGFVRTKEFVIILLVGVAKQIWMSRIPFDEWPVPDFPRPYFRAALFERWALP